MNSKSEAMTAPEKSEALVGIELGGTKIVVASSIGGRTLDRRVEFPTVDADQTLNETRRAVRTVAKQRAVESIGIASFGPLDLRRSSDQFGHLFDTPKPGWSGVDIVGGIMSGIDAPCGIDTDVNAAVRAEATIGAGKDFAHVAYLTVGTGIGGGIWTDNRVLHGANHPEIGLIRVRKHPGDQHTSSCPFHGDCLEGMASGTAVNQRWGASGERLGHRTPSATKLLAWYLARGISSLCTVVPVEIVVVGGGISKLPGIHDEIAAAIQEASGLYPPVPFAEGGPAIVPPALGDDAGVLGAIELAKGARSESEETRG